MASAGNLCKQFGTRSSSMFCQAHAWILKVLSEGGPTLTVSFCTTIKDHHRTTSKTPFMAFRWRADNGQTLNTGLVAAIFQGIWTCIARKPYIFVIFQGGGGGLDPHLRPDLDLKVMKIYPAYVNS